MRQVPGHFDLANRAKEVPQQAGLISNEQNLRVNGHASLLLRTLAEAVIWLAVGNAGTAEITALLRREKPRIETFERQPDATLLILSSGPRMI